MAFLVAAAAAADAAFAAADAGGCRGSGGWT